MALVTVYFILVSDLMVNSKRLELFDSHLYKFFNLPNIPISFIGNKNILNRFREDGEITKDVFKSFSENTSTPISVYDLKLLNEGVLISVRHLIICERVVNVAHRVYFENDPNGETCL